MKVKKLSISQLAAILVCLWINTSHAYIDFILVNGVVPNDGRPLCRENGLTAPQYDGDPINLCSTWCHILDEWDKCFSERVVGVLFHVGDNMMKDTEKMKELKNWQAQIESIQEIQNSFFADITDEFNQLQKALPQLAALLNNIFNGHDVHLESIIDGLIAELSLAQTNEEKDRLSMIIKILKKLKFAKIQLSSVNDDLFRATVKDALYGEGEKQIKAMNSFDPLVYLVLKTVFDANLKLSSSIGIASFENQIIAIKNKMDTLSSQIRSEIELEAQKIAKRQQECLDNDQEFGKAFGPHGHCIPG